MTDGCVCVCVCVFMGEMHDLCVCIALRDSLDSRGVTGEIKAKMRAEVLRSISATAAAGGEAATETSSSGRAHEHDHDDANLIINELIAEYLAFNRYRETASIFAPGATSTCTLAYTTLIFMRVCM